ncbi:MAG TPA: hypothetical protein VGX96_20030 [Candidatus Elarobacter sp.]|nr:hypothetical protein [Candidatus Elarobacter sp.]
MSSIVKRVAIAAFSVAISAAPVLANACSVCVVRTVCSSDNTCRYTITCSTTPGPCPGVEL